MKSRLARKRQLSHSFNIFSVCNFRISMNDGVNEQFLWRQKFEQWYDIGQFEPVFIELKKLPIHRLKLDFVLLL